MRTLPMTLSLLPAVLVLLGAGAQVTPPAIAAGHVREGRLSFDGRATTGSFTGTTTAVRGEMTGAASLADVRGWVEASVRTLKTGNAKRDRDLNRSMESGAYPNLRFDLSGCTPGEASGDSSDVTLAGRFTIHGVTREVTIPATLDFQPGTIRVRATVPLNLKDYQIGGLSRMLGMLRMDETILVHVDVTFAADSEASASPPVAPAGAGRRAPRAPVAPRVLRRTAAEPASRGDLRWDGRNYPGERGDDRTLMPGRFVLAPPVLAAMTGVRSGLVL